MKVFRVAEVVLEEVLGCGGQCYIMLAGLCDFALVVQVKADADAEPWPLVCRLRRNGMKMNRRLKKINRLF